MNPVKLKLLGKRALVEISKTTETPSGIVVPDEAKVDDQFRGTVVAIGMFNGPVEDPFFKPGDRVLLSNYGSMPYEEDGRQFKIVAMEDVIGVIP